jgi:hypothetical protein
MKSYSTPLEGCAIHRIARRRSEQQARTGPAWRAEGPFRNAVALHLRERSRPLCRSRTNRFRRRIGAGSRKALRSASGRGSRKRSVLAPFFSKSLWMFSPAWRLSRYSLRCLPQVCRPATRASRQRTGIPRWLCAFHSRRGPQRICVGKSFQGCAAPPSCREMAPISV